jgi:Fungal specific transcription factor domain
VTLSASILGRPAPAVLSPESVHDTLDFLQNPDNRGQLIQLPNGSPHAPVIDSSGNGLVTAFYVFFHPAHPFLLPHFQMLELLQRTRIRHLELAVQYIGSFYVPTAPTAQYYEALKAALAQENTPRDAFLVQALLLLSVGTHIDDKEEESAKMLQTAVQLALDLGMNRRDFALVHGSNHMLLEESWRRTWWEIFVIDGMMSGVNPLYKMALSNVALEVALPSDEDEYTTGVSGPSLELRTCLLILIANPRR